MQATPGPGVTQLEGAESNSNKRGKKGPAARRGRRQLRHSHGAAARRGGSGRQRLLRRGVAARPRARPPPRRPYPGPRPGPPATWSCYTCFTWDGYFSCSLWYAWLANRGRRVANWEMCFQHHLGYHFSDTECFDFFSVPELNQDLKYLQFSHVIILLMLVPNWSNVQSSVSR